MGDVRLANASAGWTADKIGRKKGVAIGAVFCLLGSALMSGSVNSDMVSPSDSAMRHGNIKADAARSSSVLES